MTEPNKPHEPMSALERLDLGMSYYKEGEFDEAIAVLKTISTSEEPAIYALSQNLLGSIYMVSLGRLDEAITAWSKIRRGDNPKTYAEAQFRLGFAYQAQDRLGDAITAWSKIRRGDDPETYAQAQLNLGIVYKDQDELDQAIKTWSSISHDDDPETYARAQFNLGVAYKDQGKLDQAIKTWSNITRDDDPETYARAQFNLGIVYKDQRKLDEAIAAWSNITRDDNPETYARAQLNLGKIYAKIKKVKEAKEAYRNVQGSLYYRGEREYKILECPPEVIKKLHDIARNTDKVREVLQIIPEFESKVAHYSRASTAFNLFEDERNNKNPSNFRLSTIRGVNDPTEGLVLRDYWEQQGISENIYTNDTATFISCFTFNHDSLNQFRLYGKENGREATGVSLVFDKDFFSDQSDVLEFISGPSTDLSSKSEQVKLNDTGKTESDNKKPLIGKSTLYRCIYLDPETGYWTLAQRDKSTFYREHDEDEDADAKEKWEKY